MFLYSTILCAMCANCQDYIRTKEGRKILKRSGLITNCLKGLHKDKNDATAVGICECKVNKIDFHFNNKQYKKHQTDNIIDMNALFKEDSSFEKEISDCYTNSGKTTLIEAEGFGNEFITSCVKGIQKDSEKKLDLDKITKFCNCQLDLVKVNKVSDAEMKTLSDPNSLFFYQIMSKCGNPFSTEDINNDNWDSTSKKDVVGPDSDTISILNMSGMSYIKAKMSSLLQIWLFDTGSTDLLINKEMEKELFKEGFLKESNYIGIGQYEMANGSIDSCRRYKINKVRLGKFEINNVVVAVTEKGKKIIIGRTILNKFSNWILDNKNNLLILNK